MLLLLLLKRLYLFPWCGRLISPNVWPQTLCFSSKEVCVSSQQDINGEIFHLMSTCEFSPFPTAAVCFLRCIRMSTVADPKCCCFHWPINWLPLKSLLVFVLRASAVRKHSSVAFGFLGDEVCGVVFATMVFCERSSQKGGGWGGGIWGGWGGHGKSEQQHGRAGNRHMGQKGLIVFLLLGRRLACVSLTFNVDSLAPPPRLLNNCTNMITAWEPWVSHLLLSLFSQAPTYLAALIFLFWLRWESPALCQHPRKHIHTRAHLHAVKTNYSSQPYLQLSLHPLLKSPVTVPQDESAELRHCRFGKP